MSDIRQRMPRLARHEGVWNGWYRYYDAQGRLIDAHRSRLVCRFPDGGPFDYDQTNHYSWPDGRTEVRPFPAMLQGDRIVFKSELIEGWAADVPLDTFARTTMLNWTRSAEPGTYLYEMIHLSDCGNYTRPRVAVVPRRPADVAHADRRAACQQHLAADQRAELRRRAAG